ncbi:hypothetical protein FGRMN_1838 [Fusarium graminum]|nr:hypothetical protein FGRMN_1838 [Fusarium graminum]
MASANFNQNYIKVEANAAVATINLGFTTGDGLANNKEYDIPITGLSTLALAKYSAGGAPRAFTLTKPVVFNPLAAVKITGGAKDGNTIEATDDHGNKAIWSLN